MPFTNLRLPTPESFVRVAKQKQHINSPFSVFPSNALKDDTLDMVGDDWDAWMEWNGTIKALPSFDSRRQSTGSSFCESDAGTIDIIKNPEFIICNETFEDDAPFELDESITSSPSFPFPSYSFHDPDESRPIKLRDQFRGNPGRPLHAYSTLSAMEERQLREIAMPDHIIAGIAGRNEQDIERSTKPNLKPRGTKRKSSNSTEDVADMCQDRKQSHNKIEQRYRVKLNDKINILRQSIPKFRDMPSQMLEDGDEEGGLTTSACKSGKAAVLAGAVEYITQLENSTRLLELETTALKVRLEAFEKLAACGSIFSGKESCLDSRPTKEHKDFERAELSRDPGQAPKCLM